MMTKIKNNRSRRVGVLNDQSQNRFGSKYCYIFLQLKQFKLSLYEFIKGDPHPRYLYFARKISCIKNLRIIFICTRIS
ncbi:hypothetical protein HanPI659440_Chr01g0021771 [Helianthus annuus]|nr:hypothetical protein HanPI659440_Chr01g0021771 [Helianthus annuus]